jgi:hypothetical protein
VIRKTKIEIESWSITENEDVKRALKGNLNKKFRAEL